MKGSDKMTPDSATKAEVTYNKTIRKLYAWRALFLDMDESVTGLTPAQEDSLDTLNDAIDCCERAERKDARIAELEREVAQMAPIIVAAERWRDSDYLPTGLAGIQIAVDDRRAARTRLLDPPSPCEQSPQPATAQEQPEDHEDDRPAPSR